MITQGTYNLVDYAGDITFYAKVAVRITVENGDTDFAISYGEAIREDWRISVAYGIVYAREHLPRELRIRKKISVEVLSIEGHPIDTTTIALMFSSAKAFWNAMDHAGPSGFALEKASQAFHIPR